MGTTARLLILGFAILAGACGSPQYRAKFEQDRQIGNGAELRGDWTTAEQAYSRAAQNAQWGSLGDQLEMESLYELGRVKRIVVKLAESEEFLTRALQLDDRLRKAYGRFEAGYTGRILAELAATYFEAGKLTDGVAALEKLEPIAGEYKGEQRSFMKQTFSKYARALADRNNDRDAQRFARIAESL